MKNLLSLPALNVEVTPGKMIRAFRKNFNLTLEEVHAITEIPVPHLSAIENDKTDIGIHRGILLAAVFGVPPSVILFPTGYQRAEDQEAVQVRRRAAKLLQRKAAG